MRFALLFGSAARGDDHPGSDVDLLVEMLDDSLDRVADLNAKLEGLAGRRMDVTTFPDAESAPSLLANALAEGRILVDRDTAWDRLRDREPALRRRANRQRESAIAGIDGLLAA